MSEKKYIQADAGDGTRAEDQYLRGWKLAITLVSMVFSLFIAALDQTIVSTILTDISKQFGNFEKIGWLTSGFLLPMACLSPLYGKLSIAFGRKYTLIAGIIIFEIGSLVSALANSMNMLIGGRVLQGVGGGAIQSMVSVILSESVPIDKRPLSMALIGVTFSVASVCGPFIGGAFSTHVTWRWCFYINLPVGGFALALLVFFYHPPLPKKNLREKLSTVDYVGTLLIAAGLVLVLLALTFGGNEYPWKSAAVICMFVIGGLVLIAFCVWNFVFSPNPLIIKEVVVVPKIMWATMTATFNFAFFMATTMYLAIYFQVIFNMSAWKSGVHLLPFIVVVSVASVCNGFFMRFTRYVKITMVTSGVLGPLGMGLFELLGKNTPLGKQIGLQFPAGISVGLMFQSSMLGAQLEAPGHVPGLMIITVIFLNFMKTLGGVIGVVTAQLMLTTRGLQYITDITQKNNVTLSMPATALLQSPSAIWSMPPDVRELLLDAFMKALKDVFYLCLGYALVAFVCSLFTTNKRIPKAKQIGHNNDKNDNNEPARLGSFESQDGERKLPSVNNECRELTSDDSKTREYSEEKLV